MKIAFVSGNQEKLPDAVIPLGLLQVMASTPARHEKLLIDLCFEPDPARALRAQIEPFGPDLVALGMRNIQTNEYSGINDNVAYYGELISHMKEATGAPIVIGGGGFSVMPGELMERLRPDFGIAGEGELAFAGLVEALEEAPERLANVPNLHRFEHGQLVSNPAASGFLDMNRLPLPDRTLLDRRYYEGYGIDSVQTKRGCPLRCDYCTYPLIEGRVARVRDPAAVVDEMFLVLEQQPATQHLFIVELDPFSAIIMIWVDDYEALDPELRKQRVELRSQIERILMKRKRDFPQWVIPALGVNFSEALFRLLRRNGLRGPLWQHIRAGR